MVTLRLFCDDSRLFISPYAVHLGYEYDQGRVARVPYLRRVLARNVAGNQTLIHAGISTVAANAGLPYGTVQYCVKSERWRMHQPPYVAC